MNRFFKTALFSLILSSITLPVFSQITFWSDMPHEELAAAIADQMTNEELLSQILMFGWAGAEPTELLYNWVARGLGSVKVFGWNTDNIFLVAKSINSLQEHAQFNRFQIPLYVATDQEGGWIRHVKGDSSDTPGNLAIGAGGYIMDAYYTGYYIGKEMRALGINMNFAPTVDLYTSIDSTVIGPRSFGEDPETTGLLGAAFAQGSMDAGVIPTAKHFPGHGDTSTDSHGNLPVIDIDRETLYNRELVPFKTLIDDNIPAIMSGHLSFPQIMKNNEPASLSKTFLTEVLRRDLGFEGLIITDDMMMNGATMYGGGFSNAVTLAIEAGNDIVISSSTPLLEDAVWRVNLRKMNNDPEFRQTVYTAARRVLLKKLEYFKGTNPVPLQCDIGAIDEAIPDPEGTEFFFDQACRSISTMKTGDFPYTAEKGAEERVLIAGQFFTYTDELLKRYPHAKIYSYKYSMSAENKAQYLENLPWYARQFDTIIMCVANQDSADLAKSLKNSGKKVIIISILSPKFAADLTWADTVLFAYSYSDFSFRAAAAVLAGEIPVYGTLPLTLPQ